MTDEQINRAIAEACGWNNKPVVRTNGKGSVWVTEWPDYCSDLNAMHEAEKVLDETQAEDYEELLGEYGFHSTARQRAEAFLRVMGKWEEVQP
jgi:hypothetical protein